MHVDQWWCGTERILNGGLFGECALHHPPMTCVPYSITHGRQGTLKLSFELVFIILFFFNNYSITMLTLAIFLIAVVPPLFWISGCFSLVTVIEVCCSTLPFFSIIACQEGQAIFSKSTAQTAAPQTNAVLQWSYWKKKKVGKLQIWNYNPVVGVMVFSKLQT